MKPPGETFEAALAAAIDRKTKPVGALGRIEEVAQQIARLQGTLSPRADACRLTIFAADHGIAEAGVSAYPQAVTRQMLLNFLSGGAAANVFASTLGVELRIVDAGVAGDPIVHKSLVARRIAAGTANALETSAMTAEQLDQALAAGRELASGSDHDAEIMGEMGIGNTSSASLVAAKLLGQPVAALTGRGTGLDDSALARKIDILSRASARTPDQLDARAALEAYGGFEIAMMAGAMCAAAAAGRLVIVDGFIASVAALCARQLAPGCESAFLYAHRSAEAGHAHVLDALGAEPMLDLGLRLGEGTGGLLAWPLVRAAAAMLNDMASFDDAGVSGPA